MKHIITPLKKEVSDYYSDFSGKKFESVPEVEFSLKLNTENATTNMEFHLTQDESKEIFDLIKTKLSDRTKDFLKKKLEETENYYSNSMECRDWGSCDYYGQKIDFYKFFLNIKEEE